MGENDKVSAKETLLSEEVELEPERVLPVGVFRYPFTFSIPATIKHLAIPSFYRGTFGHVAWVVSAELKKSKTLSLNAKASTLVPVHTLWDSNLAVFNQPASLEKNKTVCCLCCRSGPISVDLQVRRTSFGPGDSVPFRLSITNLSRRAVTCEINLVQKTWYWAKAWGKVWHTSEENAIQTRSRTEEHEKILPKEALVWPQAESHFQIPSDAKASFLTRILIFGYAITVKVKIPKAVPLKMELPIAVGSTRLSGEDVGGKVMPEFASAVEKHESRYFGAMNQLE